MNTVLGSQFETSLRVLLLLEAANNDPLDEVAIAGLDYITIYANDFDLSDSNLHGDSKYRFGEFASRRTIIKAAVKQLVLDGLVVATHSSEGFRYQLSEDGIDFAASLTSDYANAYCETAERVLKGLDMFEGTLSEMITQESIELMRRG